MKKTLLTFCSIAIFLISNYTNAQIQLEHTYPDSTRSIISFSPSIKLLKLELVGEKYLFKDYRSKKIRIYNLDHSIYKTINVPKLLRYPTKQESYQYQDSSYSIEHISQNLFNSDNKIEYVIYDRNTSEGIYDQISQQTIWTRYYGNMLIVNEDGDILFTGDSILPSPTNDLENSFIFNTSSGTKMTLVSFQKGKEGYQVYSLPGKLLSAIEPLKLFENLDALPFPNPSNINISIPYKISSNEIATITITDLMGKTIKSYKVDNTFNSLLVDLNDFKSGTYVYTIHDEKNNFKTGKFIVNK